MLVPAEPLVEVGREGLGARPVVASTLWGLDKDVVGVDARLLLPAQVLFVLEALGFVARNARVRRGHHRKQ